VDLSEYWALYVCTLICWAVLHRGDVPCEEKNRSHGESDVRKWLDQVAEGAVVDVQSLWNRGATLGLVSLTRRRLEGESTAGESSAELLLGALRVLKRLEQGSGREWL
jgi:hypothetical protein